MQSKRKINILITIAIITLPLFGILGWYNIGKRTLGSHDGDGQRKFEASNFRGESDNILPTQFETTYLEIDGVTYQTEIEENTNVYDFMEKLRSEGKINFKEKTYLGMGKFIEEINGVKSDGNKYWIYYVNGKKAEIGVSNYKLSPGDVVSWKYESQ